MNEKKTCLIGHDDDSASGWLIGLVIALVVIMVVIAIMVYGGLFIGGWHSLKNYFIALKHNVIDSNRKPVYT